jgi:hypothetical protein
VQGKEVAHGELYPWLPNRDNKIAEMRVAHSEDYDAPAKSFRGRQKNWVLYRGISTGERS